jgi:hypothetical protein
MLHHQSLDNLRVPIDGSPDQGGPVLLRDELASRGCSLALGDKAGVVAFFERHGLVSGKNGNVECAYVLNRRGPQPYDRKKDTQSVKQFDLCEKNAQP